ncbi:MAG: hypothetical protein Q4E06_10350 [Lautropia sp.]|nr:hypothetical protein [Lautropia sp.]
MRNFVTPRPPDARLSPLRATLATLWRHEQASRRFCQAVIAGFGPVAPWPQLVDASSRRIEALATLAWQWRVPLPPPTAGMPPVTPGWRNNLETALHGCVTGAGLYQQLLAGLSDPTARRLILRQQNELLTGQLPLLQRAWQAAADRERYHALQGIDAGQAYTSHGLIGDTIEQLLALLTRQGGMFGLAGTLLRAAHPALVAGAFTGSAAVQGVRLRRTLGATPVTSRQED